MIRQTTITLRPRDKGCHLVTDELLARLPELPETGVLHLFIRHTSAALTLNEDADPDVRHDADRLFDRLAPEREPYYRHTAEGDDDMPAHFKAMLTGASLILPITGGRLNLGTWQGIWLCEFRRHADARTLVATVIG